MDENEQLRGLAFAVAYRMLGSAAEAEDVVQEALLRLHQAAGVENRDAFLTTVVTRLSIDVLRSARVRRETYVGAWLPEPLVEETERDVAGRVEDEETISLAFLTLLERLGPEERAVLVLREAFDYDYREIARVVGRSEENCRQILSRARRRIEAERPRFEADPRERDELAARFLAAAREGDVDGLVALLADDAVLVGDGGGKARAIPRPLVGAAQIARALAGFRRIGDTWGAELQPVLVNGQPGVRAVDADGRLLSVLGIDVADGRVQRLHSIVNPDKLTHLGPVSDRALRPGAEPSAP
ncbi:RNA polymerase sigma-70 factor [Conexibacter woesei]|uniref:RNA polymerase, sigma-24 subunit, ECF subfamily n=1 Tax=Conexibacter woesei (strain DSM 14684 / CCUG 47730 / CIP 108061 / JCM 11494 / NBRC 100937 / ID131577) TaxID=469383 RepID=D3FA66_CONWI|nr:RNA polymerase sigma-70 factor [Conexibacter woesei]ADB53161.1 RNA polymerase, sigma-24 subunit, ECF subfamily [Conexibacter woesei DSM 14684]